MIYESVILANPEANEDQLASVKNIVNEVLQSNEGEVLLQDDWGVKKLAQPTAKGKTRGFYIYNLFKAPGNVNKELNRKLKINEHVIYSMVVAKGKDQEQEKIVKSYKAPFGK